MKHLWIREETSAPPVCQKTTVSPGAMASFLTNDRRPAMALPVETGSSRIPSVRATNSTASVIAAVGWPYPGPTWESSMSKAAMVSR